MGMHCLDCGAGLFYGTEYRLLNHHYAHKGFLCHACVGKLIVKDHEREVGQFQRTQGAAGGSGSDAAN